MQILKKYLMMPTTIATFQLILICLIFWQFRLTLKIGLTNPEGTATILKAIPINQQKEQQKG